MSLLPGRPAPASGPVSPTADPPAPPAPPSTGRRSGLRAWPRPVRAAAYVAIGLALLLVVTLVTGVTLARRPLPQVDGTVVLPGLDGEVEVLRDANGIPQIYADTVEDLMRGQGYVHAQERFFEMDVRRHATSGRLAELFGEAGLASDVLVRTMGWRDVAEQEVALVEPATRAAFEAYADGVNAYLADRGTTEIAVEYTVLAAGGLDYRPAPWTPADSLAWLKAMAWDLRGNMGDEVDRVLTAARVGTERAEELWPAYPEDRRDPVVDRGAVVDGVFAPDATAGAPRLPARAAYDAPVRDALARVRDSVAAMPSWLGRGDGLGSNSWVVSGEQTSTGKPLLANDPHLGVGMPGVWMQVGLHCNTVTPACPMDVAGFSFSGVPGVVIGHNADIAWGFTNLGPDVTDLYVERIRDGRSRRGRDYVPLTTRTETFEVAGGEDVEIEVRSTVHGPIISDAGEAGEAYADVARAAGYQAGDQAGAEARTGEDDEYAVALQWTALTPGVTADAILALDVATDWESFREAARSFEVPAQNLVYADREGNIGYQAPGRIPIRRAGNDGRLPALGWRAGQDWTGQTVPFDALPQVLNPAQGFVVAANQQVIRAGGAGGQAGYPYFLTDDWDRGYRSQRINDLIRAQLSDGGTITPDEMAQLQLDDVQQLAPVLLPHLLAADLPEGYYSDGQRVLAGWDLGQGVDSAGAAYYNVVWRNLLALTFRDELPADLWPDGGQRWFAVVTDLLERPGDAWWDDVRTEGVVETRDDVVAQAMTDARDELTRLQARDPRGWRWGGLHRLDLRSASLGESGVAAVEWLVNRDGWEAAGGGSAVNATAWDAAVGYVTTAAPSMRMVVSLADLDASRWVSLTGVSGHPASEHYADQTDVWERGETLAWPFTRDAVEAATEDTLTLTPGEG